MNLHVASKVLMIRPVCFGFNKQTADTNSFQQHLKVPLSPKKIQRIALSEFDYFVQQLEEVGIEVHIFRDTLKPRTPDSIFPNNWFTTDTNGDLLTFPMGAKNRSLERRKDILDFLIGKYDYLLNRELEGLEKQKIFLEGTGSLVIDRASDTAFVAISPRSNPLAVEAYANISGNKIVSFHALGPENELIYHTNVMLCIADRYAVVGFDSIQEEDRDRITSELKVRDKELICLSNEQVYHHFTGNMLQLQNYKGEKFLVMSSKAKRSLTSQQLKQIKKFGDQIIDVPLHLIETLGGGSARCMMAEIFEKVAL
jgi:hypothetical protein